MELSERLVKTSNSTKSFFGMIAKRRIRRSQNEDLMLGLDIIVESFIALSKDDDDNRQLRFLIHVGTQLYGLLNK